MRNVEKFNIRFRSGRLNENIAVIEKRWQVAAAFGRDIFDFFQMCSGDFLVDYHGKINVDDSLVSDDADIEKPVEEIKPDIT